MVGNMDRPGMVNNLDRTGMVNTRDKRDYEYVGTDEVGYEKVDKFSEMVYLLKLRNYFYR